MDAGRKIRIFKKKKNSTDPKQNELNTQIGGLKVAVVQLASHATPQRRQPHSQEDRSLLITLPLSQETLQILTKWVSVNYQVSLFEITLPEYN